MIQIKLLGAPQILSQDHALPTPLPAKGQALLFYLAVTSQPATRSRLAGLLWSDQTEEEARRSLRVALNALQSALPGLLHATRLEISLNQNVCQCDLARFWECLKSSNLSTRLQALDLYRGDLLIGFSVRGASVFDEWLAVERENLRQAVSNSMKVLARQALDSGTPQQGIPFTQKLVWLQAWDEQAHHLLMQLYAAAGQRSAALRQFERCRETLAQELGLEPSPLLRQLYEQLRQAPPGALLEGHTMPPHNLPTPLTPFVGRTAELNQLQDLLQQPDCRLLTLSGPGGTGKTRLALTLAQHAWQTNPELFPDGVFFIPLAGVETPDGLWTALAKALDLELQPRLAPAEQVKRFLRRCRAMLTLDNLEQLEACSGELVNLLSEAPGLKLVVTSRLALGLYEEWLFEVGGLTLGDSPANDAAQLFAQVALRARLGFNLAAEWPHVKAICRMVDGLPLGIELAASWVRSLPVREIATLVERCQADLSTPLQNMPQRHTNLRAVFQTSWDLLDTEEQRVLAGLSVFPEKFDLAAAAGITLATPRILSRLMSASLVQRTPAGRYQLHPFVRESAAAQLPAPAELQAAHARYFAGWLLKHSPGLIQIDASALSQAAAEMPNLRQMWRWGSTTRQADQLAACAAGFAALCDPLGWLQEGEDLLLAARQAAPPGSVPWAVMSLYAGHLQFRQGRYVEAIQSLRASLDAFKANPDSDQGWLLATTKNNLANVLRELGESDTAMQLYAESRATFKTLKDTAGRAAVAVNKAGLWTRLGRHARARVLGQQALAQYRKLNAQGLLVVPLASLGGSSVELGLYEEAQACFAEALKYARQGGNRLMIASLENHLGALEIHRQNFPAAEAHLLEAQRVAESIGFLEIVARASNDLGACYERQGLWAAALPVFEKALEINRITRNMFSVIINLNNLGFLKRRLGRIQEAGEDHMQALEQALRSGAIPLALDALIGLGAVMFENGLVEPARGCFVLVRQHPEADRQTQEELAEVLVQLNVPPASLEGTPPLADCLEQAAARLAEYYHEQKGF